MSLKSCLPGYSVVVGSVCDASLRLFSCSSSSSSCLIPSSSPSPSIQRDAARTVLPRTRRTGQRVCRGRRPSLGCWLECAESLRGGVAPARIPGWIWGRGDGDEQRTIQRAGGEDGIDLADCSVEELVNCGCSRMLGGWLRLWREGGRDVGEQARRWMGQKRGRAQLRAVGRVEKGGYVGGTWGRI
jgi:hypothetical protein